MLLGWHYNYYYRNAYAMNQYLANHGYIVLSVNYRSGIGYGMQFREALNYGATGASEFKTCSVPVSICVVGRTWIRRASVCGADRMVDT